GLGYPVVYANSPLLTGHAAYEPSLVQQRSNLQAAAKKLDQAGWKRAADGRRYKKDRQLTFKLYSESDSQYAYISQILQKQWRAVGVETEVVLEPESKL